MDSSAIALVVITFLAAIVNGALGYGFSSITVPVALLFLANRVLNPALVLIEVVLNAYVLFNNRDAVPNIWRRLMPMVVGLLPGILLGTALVTRVSPTWLRFITFVTLLPLILLQAAGYRRPIKSERGAGFGMPHYDIDGNDVDVVIDELTKAADRARRGEGPSYIVANTYRFRGHSMSDPMKYRSKDEAEKARRRDPIALYKSHLTERGLITDEQYEAMEEEVAAEIAEAVQQADADPHPGLEERFDDILAERYPYEPK